VLELGYIFKENMEVGKGIQNRGKERLDRERKKHPMI
jgi:hypothetical protein